MPPGASPGYGWDRRDRRASNPPPRPTSAEAVAHLLAASATGCEASFAELYRMTYTRVHTVALAVLRSSDHAHEVTQEVFFEAWRKAASCDASRGSALSWLLTIAHRRAVDRVRKVAAAAAREQAAADREGPGPGDNWDQVVDRLDARRVHAALTALTARQREVIILMYFEHHSSDQIASRLGLPVGTVKTRVRDGLRSMRVSLSPA